MTAEQITTIITNVLTGGGVAVFLYMVIRGLKAQIGSLNKTVEIQQQTLKAMETRVLETEKIGNIYRQFLEDFPKALENYRALHTKMMEDQIKLLEKANQDKDERLKKTVEIEIEKLELQQRALDDIPRLRGELVEIVSTLQQRLSTVNQLSAPSEPLLLDWVDKLREDNERAITDLLLSSFKDPDSRKAFHIWRLLSDESVPMTLEEIASTLNLAEYVVSVLLYRLLQYGVVEEYPDKSNGIRYYATASPSDYHDKAVGR